MFTGNIRAYPITNRDTPVTILLKIVPSVSLRSLRLSRQGFLYTIIFRLADLSGILSPGKQMSSSLFSRISSVHPLCVCHNSLEGFACHHCDCVRGLFMSRLITRLYFFKYDISCISPVCVPACCLPMYPPFSHGSTGTG